MQRELLEGVTAVAAVVVLFAVSFWLVSRLDHKHWLEFMRARVASAIAAGSALAFAGLGFTAVYREGFETVLFYQALAIFAKGLGLYVALGFATAVVALGVVAYAVLKLGRRIPVKPMLTAGAAILLLLSVTFAGNAVRSLQGADWVSVTPVDGGWARLPVFVAELTGIHPTREGLTVQAALLVVYVLGTAWVFGIRPWRRRAAQAVQRVSGAIRIGVDVGGTFTKAVAVETGPLRLLAHAVVPTSHEAERRRRTASSTPCATLLAELGEDRRRVALVAFSTTQAMNALLEGDVGRVGVLGIGVAARPPRRAQANAGRIGRARARALARDRARLRRRHPRPRPGAAWTPPSTTLAAAGCASIAVSGALAVDEPGA